MPLAAGVLSLAAYLITLCPTVYVEGSGELIGATHYLGTPHPTGYPLFALIGRLFTALLPFNSIAYEVNLVSAATGAATSALLCRLLQSRGIGDWAALAASLVFAFSGTFWSQSVVAEVYGMSTAMAVLVIIIGLRAAQGRDIRLYLVLTFAMGLGLTTHLSQVLLWPGLLALCAWHWPALLRSPRCLGAGLACWAIGFSPVLYLLVRNGEGPGFHWGPIEGVGDLWAHITGAVYRGSFGSMPWEGALLNAQRWAAQMAGEFHPLLVPLVLWGGWVAWRRDRSCLLVVGAAAVCNVAAAWNYHRDPNGIGVFFLLSVVAAAVLIGFGLDDLSVRLRRRAVGGPGARRLLELVAGAAPAAAAVLLVLTGNIREADRSDNWIVYEYGRQILEQLPAGAALVTEGDDAMFALDYLSRIEKVRPDVTLYSRAGRGTDLLTPAARRDPARRRQLQAQKEADLIRSGRPVHYLVPVRIPDRRLFEFVPVGLTFAAVAKQPEGRLLPSRGIDMGNATRSDLYRDPWVRKIQSNYWFMRGARQEYEGEVAAAMESYERSAEVAHDSRTVRFNTGLVLYRNNRLEDAARHLRAAVAIDPFQPAARALLQRVTERLEGGRRR